MTAPDEEIRGFPGHAAGRPCAGMTVKTLVIETPPVILAANSMLVKKWLASLFLAVSNSRDPERFLRIFHDQNAAWT